MRRVHEVEKDPKKDWREERRARRARRARIRRHYEVLDLPPEEVTPEDLEAAEAYFKAELETTERALSFVEDFLESTDWDKLEEIGNRRKEALDHLRLTLKKVEALLVDKYKGRVAAVEIDNKWSLYFGKIRGTWGLYVINGESDSSGRDLMKPVTNSSAKVRMGAVNVLEDLWNQLRYEDES